MWFFSKFLLHQFICCILKVNDQMSTAGLPDRLTRHSERKKKFGFWHFRNGSSSFIKDDTKFDNSLRWVCFHFNSDNWSGMKIFDWIYRHTSFMLCVVNLLFLLMHTMWYSDFNLQSVHTALKCQWKSQFMWYNFFSSRVRACVCVCVCMQMVSDLILTNVQMNKRMNRIWE